jgi:hypothetical protein
MFGY